MSLVTQSSNTAVPMLDPARGNAAVQNELIEAATRVIKSGKFILGAEVEAFEAACSKYIGVPHAIGMSSGTDALLAALMTLDLKTGDEVICPTFTFFATAGSIWRAGAKPVFVDSRASDFNADPADILKKITPKTRAIMPVHLFGQSMDMGEVLSEAAKRGIVVIEDCAQAIGAEYQGKRAGAWGAMGCFSFFPSKNLGAFGDAGLVTTSSEEMATRLRMVRNHGGLKTYEHHVVGGNFRIDALQAALLAVKLPHLEADHATRRIHAERYRSRLGDAGLGTEGDALILPVAGPHRHVYNQFVVRVPSQRDALQAHLSSKGISSAVYYPKPLHLQPCFASVSAGAGAHPVAERLCTEVLALPIAAELSLQEIDTVCDALVAFFKPQAHSNKRRQGDVGPRAS